MKIRKLLLLIILAFAIGGSTYAQQGTTSVTYTDGDIPTDKYFYSYYGTPFSTCPASLTVTIPVDAFILNTEVSYDMMSDENSGVYRQRSHFRCVSPDGINEPAITKGTTNNYSPGTESYSRTVDIANGVNYIPKFVFLSP